MRLEWSADALADLDRFAAFLHERHPRLAGIVAEEIIAKTHLLAEHPRLGRALGDNDEYRQITLNVLNAAYVLQYRIDGERVVMLRVFHGREKALMLQRAGRLVLLTVSETRASLILPPHRRPWRTPLCLPSRTVMIRRRHDGCATWP